MRAGRAPASRRPRSLRRSGSSSESWQSSLRKSLQQAMLRWSEACDVVCLHPARRSYRKTALGATGKLPGGRKISAIEGRLGGGEIGVGEVALAAIGHGELVVGVGDFGVGLHGGA